MLALTLWAVALWLLPFGDYNDNVKETRYGMNEGMEVVEQTVADGQRQYIVEDARGNMLFRIPLRGCMIDTRFRSGRLRFREMATGREGYVDTNGMVTFTAGTMGQAKAVVPEDNLTQQSVDMQSQTAEPASTSAQPRRESHVKAVRLSQTDIRKIAQSSPFYNEAAKRKTHGDRCFAPPADTQLLRTSAHGIHHQGHRLPPSGLQRRGSDHCWQCGERVGCHSWCRS